MAGAAQRTPTHIRIFLASPGDVQEERRLARQLIKDRLPYHPWIEDVFSFKVLSWDDPESGTPMLGSLSRQECVSRFKGEPANCDVVIGIFGARMGTPLPDHMRRTDGGTCLSGTEWEIDNAATAPKRPVILVYRCAQLPLTRYDDPLRDEKQRQFDLVTQYFDRLRAGTAPIRNFATYDRPDDFARQLENDLFQVLRLRLEQDDAKEELAKRIAELEARLAEKDRLIAETSAAVDAVAATAGSAESQERVEDALQMLAAGDAEKAKAILRSAEQREGAEGRAALARAADAARHLGTLAMLDDTLEALAAFRRAADLDPSDTWTWIYICRLEQQRGDLAAAADAARRARQTAEAKGEERDVKVATNELGDVLVAQGDLAAALKSYRDAFATAQRLADADPGNAQCKRDLSVSQEKIGVVLTDQGNLAQALESYNASHDIFQRLADADPGNAQWQYDVALSLERIGLIDRANDDREGALRVWQRGLAIMQRLTTVAPDHAGFTRDRRWFEDRLKELDD